MSDTFGDTFASTPASKNRFRNIPTRNRATRASGFGVTLPPPRPQKSRKKKIPKKKFRTLPPAPLPSPLLIGNRRERSEKIPRSDKKRPLEFRRATKPLGDPELSPGRRSSNQTRTVHQKVNQSNQTSLHRYLPWPIISTLTS